MAGLGNNQKDKSEHVQLAISKIDKPTDLGEW
jgi:hypothetical protein